MNYASLFSGCGGFDLGFGICGFHPLAAYDFDSDAVQNYRANLAGPIHNVDLTGGIPNEQKLCGIDAIISGPPCQGFSTAGRRRLDDERNHLLTLTGILAARIRPKVLIVENVAGALAGHHARYWHELDFSMRVAGYRTHTLRCQAADLGMAQLRKRVFFIAWRTGRELEFVVPKINCGKLKGVLSGLKGMRNHRPRRLKPGSVEWRIAEKIASGKKLSNVRGGDNAVPAWDIPEVFQPVTEHERTVLELLRRLRRQDRKRDHGDADPVSLPRLEAALGRRFQRLIDSLIDKGYVRRVGACVDLVGTFNGKFRRLAWESPSCTVDTRFGSPRYFLHPSQPRGFTVREAARIQGFPDQYVFTGDEKAQFRLIGNAVPPPLGALAAGFAARLLGKRYD